MSVETAYLLLASLKQNGGLAQIKWKRECMVSNFSLTITFWLTADTNEGSLFASSSYSKIEGIHAEN